MIICHCTGASDRDVRRAVREGARTVREIGFACGAAAACGGCRDLVMALLLDELKSEGAASVPLTAA